MEYRSKRILMSVISVILLSVCYSCGYGFRAKGEPIGIAIDSLAIPLFESTSTERGFEAEFTEAIRDEFITHAKVRIVSAEQAGTILKGRISLIATQPMSYNTVRQSVGDRVVSYEADGTRKMIVKLDITMTDKATGKIIWHDTSMEEETDFKISGDPLQDRYSKDQAIKNIARLMAKRIYLNTMERF